MANEFTQFGMRSGNVDIPDYDLAIARKLGGIFDREQNEWYLPINYQITCPDKGPIKLERALIVTKRPEPTQVEHKVPQLVISMDDLDPDPSRLYTIPQQYRVPAAGAHPISIEMGGVSMLGYDCYETKDQEEPYNFTYTIEAWARYKVAALNLIQIAMRAFPVRPSKPTITVYAREEASRNVVCPREYRFSQEGFADLTEINSMVERIPGYALTIRIEGELTSDKEPITVRAFTGTTSEDPIPGTESFPGGNPSLPPGGLYGDGLPSIRATLLED